jgi:hypothetical protein
MGSGPFGVAGAPTVFARHPAFGGRLTLTSGLPVTTADVTGGGIIYYTPYVGDELTLFSKRSNLNRLRSYNIEELSLDFAPDINLNYDVYVHDDQGTPKLELGSAWASDTSRTDALVYHKGLLVKSIDRSRLYLGSIHGSATGVTEDSRSKRFMWNHYNRVLRHMYAQETTNSWTYAVAAYRAANGLTVEGVSRVAYVQGVSEDPAEVDLMVSSDSDPSDEATIGIGVDSTTVNSARYMNASFIPAAGTRTIIPLVAKYVGYPGIGYHFLQWLEYAGAGTVTYMGDAGVTWIQSGLVAKIWA